MNFDKVLYFKLKTSKLILSIQIFYFIAFIAHCYIKNYQKSLYIYGKLFHLNNAD